MKIIRDQTVVDDNWQHVPDGQPLAAGPITVSLSRWRTEAAGLLARGAPLGVRLEPHEDVAALAGDLKQLALVVLEFALFNEGRGYSQARILRDRYGFTGELRASGNVTRDHVAFMSRCGVNAFELRNDCDLDDALSAGHDIGIVMQPGSDGQRTAADHRRNLRPRA